MKGIVSEDITELELILNNIDSVMSPFFKSGTTTYSYILQHPIDSKYSLIIDLEDITLMQQDYPTQLVEIGEDLITRVEQLDSSWITEIEEI